jgi:FKBP-type peptidyl-prolyl cis-trans isomerase
VRRNTNGAVAALAAATRAGGAAPLVTTQRHSGVSAAAATLATTLAACALLAAGCSRNDLPNETSTASTPADTASTPATPPPAPADDAGAKDTSMATAPTELQSTDLKTGTGPAIAKGKTAVVHYTGWLYSDSAPDHKGTKFDSSLDRNDPFSFGVGNGDVIGGWDKGVVGMQVGGQRRLVIPPSLGYGASGAGGVIPPNATLVFDVQLLAIK